MSEKPYPLLDRLIADPTYRRVSAVNFVESAVAPDKARAVGVLMNFGDCFSYALARSFGEPLLFKGGDFTNTDIASALPAGV